MFMGRSKYSNKRIEIDGKKFDSKKESYRYLELDGLRKAGIIKDLELQPRYPMVINGIKVTTYIADFRYIDVQSGEKIVEDTKGFKTVVYKLKKKLMLALHDITIQET
jgi:hypothetical protein|tara:strand:+ start:346 stop:669 length:324 start_codon:yes stop_codon:yes gene_type:complete